MNLGKQEADDETVPKATNGLFEITVLNCVYERVSSCLPSVAEADGQKFNRSHEDASDADLKALTYVEKVKAKSPRKKQDDVSVEDKLAALAVTNKEPEPEVEAESGGETEDPFQDVPVLSRTTAELYLFDTETDVFVIQEKEVDVGMASNGDFESRFGS